MTRLSAVLLPAVLLAAALTSMAACAAPTTAMDRPCQPVNRYDTRCEPSTTVAASPQPVTLTRSHVVLYELTGRGTVLPLRATLDASNEPDNVGDEASQATAPWTYRVVAPPGMTPLLLYPATDRVACRIMIDGRDVTGTFPDSSLASDGVLEVCGATREP